MAKTPPISTPATDITQPDTAFGLAEAPGAGAGDPDPTPGDLLADKEKALKEARDQLAGNSEAAKALEAKIKDLGSWISEYRGYEAAAKARADNKEAIKNNAQKTIDDAKLVLTDGEAARIDAEVKEYRDDLTAQLNQTREARGRADDAAAEAARAQAAVKEAQAAYDTEKDGSKAADAELKRAGDLLARAQRAATSVELAAAYFLAKEAFDTADSAQVLTLEARDKRLQAALKVLSDATAAAAKAKAESDKAAATAAEFAKRLEEARNARIDDLLKTIGRKFMAVEETA